MAQSLANLMFQEASQNIRDTKADPEAMSRSYARGAAIAQKDEQLKINREQMEGQKQMMEAKQDQFLTKELETFNKMKSPKMRNLYADQMVTRANERGRPLDPTFVKALKTVDLDPAQMSAFTNEYNEAWEESLQLGKPTERLAAARGELAGAAYQGDITKLIGMEAQENRARIAQGAANARKGMEIKAREEAKQKEFTQVAEKTVKAKAGADFAKFKQAGGRTKLEGQLRKLERLKGKLENGELKTGGLKYKIASNIPFYEQMEAMRLIDSDMAVAMDDAQAAVNVKSALDSQFSDAMATRVFSRAFDPQAPTDANIQKLNDMITELNSNIDAQESLFQRAGLGEFGASRKSEDPNKSGETFVSKQVVEQTAPVYKQLVDAGKSPEEIFQMMKASEVFKGVPDDKLNAILKQIQIRNK